MSEASYRLNARRGVTGPHTSTCLMASYDRISPVTGVRTETYREYEDLRDLYVSTVGDGSNFVTNEVIRKFRELKEVFRAELGVPTPKNIIECRVRTKDELHKRLSNLAIGGYRPAVYLDTGGLHAVGVMQLDDEYYDVRSTWSPFPEGPVSIDQIYEYLDQAPRIRKRKYSSKKTVVEPNLVALPPEPAKSASPYPKAL